MTVGGGNGREYLGGSGGMVPWVILFFGNAIFRNTEGQIKVV